MAAQSDAPWVLVAGGFHDSGGMDRANAALAHHLAARGTAVHLVGHDIDASLAAHPRVTVHHVPRPARLPGLAGRLLASAGTRVARAVVARAPRARVVVNGGNCPWPDVNWVHAVHAAWPVRDEGAPWWVRARNRLLKRAARRLERTALGRARLVIANSEGTRQSVIERLGVESARVRTVYLGSEATWEPVGAAERRAARAALDLAPDRPVVAFVGALGADVNKGFDVLWTAWDGLVREAGWDAQLLVAGDGWRLARWRADAVRSRAGGRVRFVGATARIREVLAAADLLVSPVRYEAYGLNVHEALSCGLAVLVTRSAGVAERFDPAMAEALLPDGATPAVLARRLAAWRADVQGWRTRAASTGAALRTRTWQDMAAELAHVVDATRPEGAR